MATFDPINALSYGVIGLGFLLAFLAYRLLGREQQKKVSAAATLRAIYVFMLFSFSLTALGLGSEFMKLQSSTADISQLNARYDQQKTELDNETKQSSQLKEQLAREIQRNSQQKAEFEREADQRNKLKEQLEQETRQKITAALSYINRPLQESVRICTINARGATTNTSDLRGCLAAAGTAATSGEAAEGQIGDLKNLLRSVVGLPAEK